MERPADIEEGFSLLAPLVFHYGHKSPSDNIQLYDLLVARLAEVINLRCEANKNGKVIIFIQNFYRLNDLMFLDFYL